MTDKQKFNVAVICVCFVGIVVILAIAIVCQLLGIQL